MKSIYLIVLFLFSMVFSEGMNAVTLFLENDSYYGYYGDAEYDAGGYIFNEPITQNLEILFDGNAGNLNRTYHFEGPMGGYTLYHSASLSDSREVEIEITGDFSVQHTVQIPDIILITSNAEYGNQIPTSGDLVVSYSAVDADFFVVYYQITYYDDYTYENTYLDSSYITEDTQLTLSADLLVDAYNIYIDIDAMTGKHPLDEIAIISSDTMLNIWGLSDGYLNLYSSDYRSENPNTEDCEQPMRADDTWNEQNFLRLYSEIATENQEHKLTSSRDINADDISLYAVMSKYVFEDYNYYYGYEDMIDPFFILLSPSYPADALVTINGTPMETGFAWPFGLTVWNSFAIDIGSNTLEIDAHGQSIVESFSFPDPIDEMIFPSIYDGADDLYIEWTSASEAHQFYRVHMEINGSYTYYDSTFVTTQTNLTIPSALINSIFDDYYYSSYYDYYQSIRFEVVSVYGPVPTAGMTGNVDDSFGFLWAETSSLNGYAEIIYTDEDELGISTPLPIEFGISNAYPNPFNPLTTINFSIPNYNRVSMDIYDIHGRLIKTLVDSYYQSGSHSVTWNASESVSGVYFIKLRSGSFVQTQKVILAK